MNDLDFTAGANSGHDFYDSQAGVAAVGAADFPGGHGRCEAQPGHAAGEHNPPAPASAEPTPMGSPPVLAPNPWASSNNTLLSLLADVLDDLERTRIANENRLRQLTRQEADSDGEVRGFGFTLEMPQVAAVDDLVSALGKLEHAATLNLRRALRKHPLGPWVKATVGVGEKQGARLIAAIGDPYWNTLHDRPRLVSELWAYCGLHVLPVASHVLHGTREKVAGDGGKQGDPGHCRDAIQRWSAGVAPTRARGQKANWSAAAKMRVYLVAESCIKQARSPYRSVYDAGRAKYAEATHETECRRCGPSGNPARIGTAISAGHQHARAMRLVMKEILKDLWRESRRLHGAPDSPA
ncbi:hypothetical protein ACIRVF_07905 [Kitasatospora sp. NPDC101157]|uniref:hypothetical protein n=1 Tax=Kitasatospora sp. NPDC101157 TaxID=3364098 RepID=UPI0038208363